ncbi:MAG TPA: DUF4905 domain-containing protein [Ignavibacteriaceae bacterium]|nr:DUF4905 domain-containing protein [Ignavibacteriaceae bacterium]
MKFKKLLKHNYKRQIWRLLLNKSNHLLIEERDAETKAVSYSLYDFASKKYLLDNYKFEEEFWIGVEAFTEKVMLMHKYVKPDMPTHKGMKAFSFIDKRELWENNSLNFLFVKDDDVYCFSQRFEGKEFFIIDLYSGEIRENLRSDYHRINRIKNELDLSENNSGYVFPETLHPLKNEEIFNVVQETTKKINLTGSFEYLGFNGSIFVNFHKINKDGTLDNIFRVIEPSKQKVIFEETLNKKVKNLFIDSFFIKDNLLFLLMEKSGVAVYRLD